MHAADVATPCIAVLGLLLFGGGLWVSLQRLRFKRLLGHADDPAHPLTKAVRAHGNTAEYAAFMALLIYLLGQRGGGDAVAWLMIGGTASRLAFFAGMVFSPNLSRPHPVRFAGALGTYAFGLAMAVALWRG